MGHFAPVLLAFILNSFGIYIFREPKDPGSDVGPFISGFIFLFSLFLLLWDIKLYPKTLRMLNKIAMRFLDFLTSAFIMEHVFSDFWAPLEACVFAFLPKLSDTISDLILQTGWSSGVCDIFEFLKSETTAAIGSYLLSTFFLFSVLHATRAVDFRLLKCGPGFFCNDVVQRSKRFKKRVFRVLGLKKKRRVCFAEKPMSRRSSRPRDADRYGKEYSTTSCRDYYDPNDSDYDYYNSRHCYRS